MRAPADMPRRTPRAAGRGRIVLVVAIVALFVLATSLRGIAGFYTDYLWFDSLELTEVWTGVLGAKLSLVALFTLTFFVLLWVNLHIADRLAPPFRSTGPEDELIERYQDLVAGRTVLVRTILAAVLALIAGTGVAGEWRSWILFRNGGDFGVQDPQFGVDVGFYVFKLPFLSFVVGWLFAALLIVLIVTTVAHYLNGGIRITASARNRVTPAVKGHLSVLLAVLALVKALGYWLQRYELTLSTRGVVDGATYTDVKAQLPAVNLLLLISAASVVLFIVNIWRRGWVLPSLGVGLWALVAVIAGGIYPQFVQRVQVQPNESVKESPYIDRNIAATRAALGLDEVEVVPFTPQTGEEVTLADNLSTIRNIRLWDPVPSISGKTFQQLQGIRDYYRFNDIDIDRYTIDGELTQVLVGARDLDPSRVPQKSWEGQHLAYTHGYGVVMAPANGATGGSRQPDFQVRDIPVANETDLQIDQTQLYFGENLGGYVIVNTDRREIDYQDDDETRFTEYQGEDGIGVGSLLRRAAFALRFGNYNPLISDFIRGDSKLIMQRDVNERVRMLAPFLDFDHDAYPVVLDGGVVWVIDGYTTSGSYPYAQRADNQDLPPGSGLDHSFNYVRNSVKAVVDAYDGDVTFYVVDDEDPIVDAYRKAFPKLFTDGSEMPEELRAHLRYPEDLFRVQTNMWGRYHLSQSDAFFNRDDAWVVAQDPGTAGAGATTQATDEQGNAVGPARAARIAPYYQLLQLPGEDQAEFALLRPFAPFSDDDTRQQLTSFMVARADGDDYGKLRVYEMPRSDLPQGPGIAGASIQADQNVGQLETLLSGAGTEVRYGNLLLVPIDGALLYVQPFYVEAQTTSRQIPQLQKVIAVLNDDVVIEDTLAEALFELFDERVDTGETAPTDPIDVDDPDEPDEPGGSTTATTTPPTSVPAGSAQQQIATLLSDADRLFAEADEALRRGDLGTYGTRIEEARAKVEAASTLLEAELGGSATTTTTTTAAPAA
ncbi:MAG: UPF0182 family protein [Acidimicrobiia bacterium]